MLTDELPGKRIEPPSKKVQLDVRLDEVVLRALEREPERRYQHASQVKSHVETTASGIPANDPFEPKTGRVENRNRILAGTCASFVDRVVSGVSASIPAVPCVIFSTLPAALALRAAFAAHEAGSLF